MKRRDALLGVGVFAFSGCLSAESADDPTSTETPPTVTLSSTDVEAATPDATLQVGYVSGVAMRTPSDPPTIPNEGMKFLFVAMRITNGGDCEYEVTGAPFVLQARGEQYGIVVTKHEDELRRRTLQPGTATAGWLMYQLPYNERDATLMIRGDTSRRYTVAFERAPVLASELPPV